MAVQKNFVVQNGIEVNKNLIFANSNSGKVGIATTNVQYTLHVNGGIGATDLKVTGVGTFKDLVINGRVTAGSSLGLSGQYLISTGAGVTWASLPSVRTVDTQIATAGQTTFTTQYLVGLLDVYINGVRLSSDEYTATNSIQVILDYACFGGETVEFISYSSVAPGAGFTGIQGLTILDEGVQVGNSLQVSAIDFVGYALTASGTGMAVTVYSGQRSQWVTLGPGIHTTSNVGIGTTNPQTKLHVVGSGNTTLLVEGDVRIVGVLTVGSSSITIDGNNNIVSIGTAILGDSSGGANYTGIVTAFKFIGDGSELTNVGAALSVSVRTGVGGTNSSEISNVKAIRFNSPSFTVTDLGGGEVFVNSESTFKTWYVDGEPTLVASGDDYLELIAGPGIAITTRNTASGVGTGEVKSVTITSTGGGGSSQWVTTGSGIHTTSNVGVGTTNPQTKLQIGGVLGFNNSNVRIGDNTTGANLTSGCNNIFMGVGAGNSATTGRCNNFFGLCAGYFSQAVSEDNYFGPFAGYCSNGGHDNNFLGCCSGAYNTGSYNNFFNNCAGYCNQGNSNNFFNYESGFYNTTGSYNNFMNEYSGKSNTSGSSNNFLGYNSGRNNTTGSDNNFFGRRSGNYNIIGSYNIFLGTFTGISTASSNKIVLGRGYDVSNLFDSPDTTKDTQLAIGIRTDANPSKYWLVGNENFNVGIGTTNPQYKLDVGGDLNFTGTLYQNGVAFSGGGGGGAFSYCCTSNITSTNLTSHPDITTANNNFFAGCGTGSSITDGCGNNFIGYCAGYHSTNSNDNNFFGSYAGYGNTSGSFNNFIGYRSGICNISGESNTFFGTDSGSYNTTGNSNIFIGNSAGCSNTIGSQNVVIGFTRQTPIIDGSNQLAIGAGSTDWIVGNENFNVGIGTTNPASKLQVGGEVLADRYLSPNNNVFLGTCSGHLATGFGYNNFFGYYSGAYSSESSTTAIGCYANYCGSGGGDNNFLGYCAGAYASECYSNVIGYCAGYCSSGGYNNFFGCYAGAYNTGCHNTFIGECAGSCNTGNFNFAGGYLTGRSNTGYDNNFIGTRAGAYGTGSCNNFMGYCTGYISTGSHNNFFGWYSGCGSTGNYNNFFGYCSGYDSSSTNAGSYNNFFGAGTGSHNTSGCSNNYIGEYSGWSNTTGSYNNFFGQNAGNTNTTGSNNNFIGNSSGYFNCTGQYNNFMGNYSGYSNEIGDCNNFFGLNSGKCNISGNNNQFIGANAGFNATGSDNIYIGVNAGCNNTTGSENIVIGSNRTSSPILSGSNQLVIGAGSTNWIVGNNSYNIGIGTTNPTSKLTVGGNTLITGSVTATDGFISNGNSTPIQISLVGNQLTFTAVGIGSTTFTLA